MSKIHTTIGLYPNGDFKTNGVLPEHLEEHIEYNKKWRPGRSLYVDEELVYKGLNCNEAIENFKGMPEKLKVSHCTVPYV